METKYDLNEFNLYGVDYKIRKNGDIAVRKNNRYYKIGSKTANKVINLATDNNPNWLLRQRLSDIKFSSGGITAEIPYDDTWEDNLRKLKFDSLIVKIRYDDGKDSFVGIQRSNLDSVNKIIDFVKKQETFYEEKDLGSPTSIIVTGVKPQNEAVFPLGLEGYCVLGCIKEQKGISLKKYEKLKKETPAYIKEEYLSTLEDLTKCCITIFDGMGHLWRISDKTYRKKVLIRATDFHADNLNNRIIGFEKLKSVNVNYDVVDGMLEPKPLKSVNIHHSTIKPIKPTLNTNKWVSQSYLNNLHVDYLHSRHKHFPLIDGAGEIIGLVDSVNNINYKTLDRFQNALFIPKDTRAWSISSYLLYKFKQHLLDTYGQNSVELTQVTDFNIYSDIKSSQRPLHHIFKSSHKSKGKIHQIDQRKAYTNASIGNVGDDLKSYIRGYATAPRNVLNLNQELTAVVAQNLKDEYYGYATITYDQTHLQVKTFFDGTIRDKASCCIPIDAVIYMFDQGVKIFIHRLYYSTKNFDPFTSFHDTLVKERSSLTLDRDDMKVHSKMFNNLIGSLNKNTTQTHVTSTISRTELNRITHLIEKKKYKIVNIATKPYDKSKYTDPSIVNDLLDERYVYYYQTSNQTSMNIFQMAHLSGEILFRQKMVLHNEMVKLVNKGSTLLYTNTDCIAYSGPCDDYIQIKEHPLFHVEHCKRDEFIAPKLGTTCFIKTGRLTHQRRSGSTRDYTLTEFRNMTVRGYSTQYNDFNFIVRPNMQDYTVQGENQKRDGQMLRIIQGSAGYGKSEISKFLDGRLSKYNNDHKFPSKQTVLCASTHASRKVIGANRTFAELYTILLRCPAKFPTCERIVIDEAFMISAGQFNEFERLLRKHTGVNSPFGGLDIVLIGDPKQTEPRGKPLSDSNYFKLFTIINLTKNYRQCEDAQFACILNKIRSYYEYAGDDKSRHSANCVLPNILTKPELKALNARVSNHPTKQSIGQGTTIHYSNRSVFKSIRTITDNKFVKDDKVLLRSNRHKKKGFYNGDILKVESSDAKKITLKSDTGRELVVPIKYTVTQPTEKYPEVHSIHGMTVHCTQGQTMDSVWVNIKGFSMSLLYVALSRVRRLSNLQLSNAF